MQHNEEKIREMRRYFNIQVSELITIYSDGVSSLGKFKNNKEKYTAEDFVSTDVIFDNYIKKALNDAYNRGIEDCIECVPKELKQTDYIRNHSMQPHSTDTLIKTARRSFNSCREQTLNNLLKLKNMNLQTILNNAVQAQRQEELKNSSQLLLGEIILKLEAVLDKSKPLFIDLMDKRPKGINSWRGVYAELAIQTESFGSYQHESEVETFGSYSCPKEVNIGKENPTVEDWIKVLKEAIGKTFTGYKGGDFKMGKNTPVYLAEYGESSFKIDEKELDTENYSNYKTVYFVDVREESNKVYLVTKIEE